MRVIEHPRELISHLEQTTFTSLGLVPTMGYLHPGHISLVHRAQKDNELVAASIFVNPLQFNDPSDLSSYPTSREQDLILLEEAGCNLVFCPTHETIYPKNFSSKVSVDGITKTLEGASRPGHFDGVTTVVAKLFNLFLPTRAYFGEKDAQQLSVIQKMVLDMDYRVEVVPCPTVREASGLAMSSRNSRLSSAQKSEAALLFKALQLAKHEIQQGNRDASVLKDQMGQLIEQGASSVIDYISICHPLSLEETDVIDSEVLVSLAVFVGPVRLIDNMRLYPPE